MSYFTRTFQTHISDSMKTAHLMDASGNTYGMSVEHLRTPLPIQRSYISEYSKMSILEMISVGNLVLYKYCKTNSVLKIRKYLKNPSGQNFTASKQYIKRKKNPVGRCSGRFCKEAQRDTREQKTHWHFWWHSRKPAGPSWRQGPVNAYFKAPASTRAARYPQSHCALLCCSSQVLQMAGRTHHQQKDDDSL